MLRQAGGEVVQLVGQDFVAGGFFKVDADRLLAGHHAQLGGGADAGVAAPARWLCRRAAAGFPARWRLVVAHHGQQAGLAARAAMLRATLAAPPARVLRCG